MLLQIAGAVRAFPDCGFNVVHSSGIIRYFQQWGAGLDQRTFLNPRFAPYWGRSSFPHLPSLMVFNTWHVLTHVSASSTNESSSTISSWRVTDKRM